MTMFTENPPLPPEMIAQLRHETLMRESNVSVRLSTWWPEPERPSPNLSIAVGTTSKWYEEVS